MRMNKRAKRGLLPLIYVLSIQPWIRGSNPASLLPLSVPPLFRSSSSPSSLAEVYESEFVATQTKEEKSNPAHAEIQKKMDSLFRQLDALANFHFVPRPAAADVTVLVTRYSVLIQQHPIRQKKYLSAILCVNYFSNFSQGLGLLDASTHLYKRLCPSVGWSVGLSVHNHFF